MKIKNIFLIVLFLLFASLSFARGNLTSVELIERAQKNGKISQENAILYKYYSVVFPEKLPKQYRSDEIIKSGTKILKQIRNEIENLSEKSKKLLPLDVQKYSLPTPESYNLDKTLSTTNFDIYYTTSGTHSVPTTDTNPANGISDYVEWVGSYAEISYEKIITDMGYLLPPKSSFPKYRIYLINIRPYYGWCDYKGGDILIAVDCKMDWVASNEDPEGKQKGALKVTVAHEFFHAVKAAYNWDVDAPNYWFDESTSTWVEEVVFPQVNDYLRYLKEWFSNPSLPLDNADGLREYGSCIFSFYLDEKIGRYVIRQIWERIKHTNATTSLPHIKYVIDSLQGKSFEDEFRKFTVANYKRNYIEGSKYPQILPQKIDISGDKIVITKKTLNYLATNYFKYETLSTLPFEFNFDGDDGDGNIFAITIIKLNDTENLSVAKPYQTTTTFVSKEMTIVINNIQMQGARNYIISNQANVDFSLPSPSNITVEKKDDFIKVSWDAVHSEKNNISITGYNIYRGTKSNNFSSTPIASLGLVNFYEDRNVTSGTSYYYAVTSVASGKESLIKTLVGLQTNNIVSTNIFNWPNPTRGITTIQTQSINKPYKIIFRIFNLAGREILSCYYLEGTVKSETRFTYDQDSKKIEFDFNTSNLPNGVYIYLATLYFQKGGFVNSKGGKLVVLK